MNSDAYRDFKAKERLKVRIKRLKELKERMVFLEPQIQKLEKEIDLLRSRLDSHNVEYLKYREEYHKLLAQRD